MSYVIDKGVPIPGADRAKGITDTLRRMKVGDSFLVAVAQRTSVYSCAKHVGLRIAVRAEGDALRVWRIEGDTV